MSSVATWVWRRHSNAQRRMRLLADRVRGEYREMPGLRLTLRQACRLWQLDPRVCEEILNTLIERRFLYRTLDGRYLAFGR